METARIYLFFKALRVS